MFWCVGFPVFPTVFIFPQLIKWYLPLNSVGTSHWGNDGSVSGHSFSFCDPCAPQAAHSFVSFLTRQRRVMRISVGERVCFLVLWKVAQWQSQHISLFPAASVSRLSRSLQDLPSCILGIFFNVLIMRTSYQGTCGVNKDMLLLLFVHLLLKSFMELL